MAAARVVFINLGIDQQWAEGAYDRFFPIRSPALARYHLGLDQLGRFFCSSGDILVTRERADATFADFLSDMGVPRVENFLLSEIRPDGSDFLFAGISALEAALDPRAAPRIAGFRRWNSKDFLSETASDLHFAFPGTRTVSVGKKGVSPAIPEGAWLLKTAFGANGSGILEIRGDGAKYGDLLTRMSGETDSHWLLQELLKRAHDFYTLAEVDGNENVRLTGSFAIEYDTHRSSWRHSFSYEVEPRVAEAVLSIGKKLGKEGFRGSFGADGFVTADDRLFPVIDLNVRIDKCRAILKAAESLGLHPEAAVSQRFRIPQTPVKPFAENWSGWTKQLGLGVNGRNAAGDFCIPYLYTRAGDGCELCTFANTSFAPRVHSVFNH
jgi:hypothetical protein